jgi:SAM-dependent methyltransferase
VPEVVQAAHPTGNPFNRLAKQQLEGALAAAARNHARGRLVDIGCGEKPYVGLFAEYVDAHVGVDHPDSPHALTSVDVLASAYEIPLADQTFDTALMIELLEHLETPAVALAEAHRLLRPGGWLILTTPFIWVLHEEPRDFFRYTPHALRYLLEAAGFGAVGVTPLSGQWSTLALLGGYALRDTRLGLYERPLASVVGAFQRVAARLDARERKAWMSWNHIAVARRPD